MNIFELANVCIFLIVVAGGSFALHLLRECHRKHGSWTLRLVALGHVLLAPLGSVSFNAAIVEPAAYLLSWEAPFGAPLRRTKWTHQLVNGSSRLAQPEPSD
jgi:hypothetical protein